MSNYYLALGIEKDADLSKIKKAYRHYCKKYHPDLSSQEQKTKFLRIQEAYDTLADEEKRKAYDRSLARNGGGSIPVEIRRSAAGQAAGGAEKHFRRFSSLLEDYFEGFLAGFFEEGVSRKELYLELILSPAEARKGGEFPIEIPVAENCPTCGGRGHLRSHICLQCGGMGRRQANRSFVLHVPGGIAHGTTTRVSLEGIGLREVFLNIELSITG